MLIFMNINADTFIIDSLAAQITKRGKDQGNIYDEDHQSQPKSWNVKHRAEMFTHQSKAREKFALHTYVKKQYRLIAIILLWDFEIQ